MSSINEERPAPVQPAQAPTPAFNPPPRKADTQHGELAGFLARGREDGMDTFGNMGNLRMSFSFYKWGGTDGQDSERTIHLVDLSQVSSSNSSRANKGRVINLSSRSEWINRLSSSRIVML